LINGVLYSKGIGEWGLLGKNSQMSLGASGKANEGGEVVRFTPETVIFLGD